MHLRPAAAMLALALVAGMASGCSHPAEPQPTPTAAFSSEEEAFAAAEATYRAYVDALNQVDLSDPTTFEDVYAWTTGDANAGERKSLSAMHADGWTVVGQTTVTSTSGVIFAPSKSPTVVLTACTDVSGVDVLDAQGQSVVSPTRPATQSSTVHLIEKVESPTGLLISSIEGSAATC